MPEPTRLDVVGDAPLSVSDQPTPRPSADGGRDLFDRLLGAPALALAGFTLSLVNLLGLTAGGIVASLADTLTGLDQPKAEAVTPGDISRAVLLATLILGGLAVGLAVAAVRRSRSAGWWDALAGAAVVLSILAVAVQLFGQTTPPGAGFSQ